MDRGIRGTHVACGLLLLGLVSGCGTDPVESTVPPQAISVSVTPATVSVPAGGSQDLSATVVNDSATRGVTWSITGCAADASMCGSLGYNAETSVTYHAPLAVPPATLGVRATSVTDSTKSSTARVTLNATLWIAQPPTNSGNGQTATVGTALASPLRVLVRRGAEPAAGVTVHWDSVSGGVASSPSTTTDASGIANVTWTLGQLSGQQWAIASISDTASRAATVQFAAFARPGPPLRLTFPLPPLSVFAGRAFYVQVAALDQYGNVATDFRGSVTITLGPGGSLAGAITAPAVGGVASFADLSISQTGTSYTLTASANALPPVTSAAFDVVTPGSGRIAFTSDRSGCPNIYAMNADGLSVVELTTIGYCGEYANNAAWSPDGMKIAYEVTPTVWWEGSLPWIITMNADGSQPTSPFDGGVEEPAWSPDGARIAGTNWGIACGARGGGCGRSPLNPQIFVAYADGSGFAILASHGHTPAWSPDGTKLAFADHYNPDHTVNLIDDDIYVINVDGTAIINLTNSPGSDDSPAWSPDGTKIAFRSNRAGHYDLYVMNADGSGVTQLTGDTATEGRPAWSPDGTRIAFASDRDGDNEIYVMNADGSGVVQLTDNASWDGRPAWTR